jgi:hypothetical protein
MATEPKHKTAPKAKLTKFPNPEKANQETSSRFPSAFSLFEVAMAVVRNNLVAFFILLGIPLALTLFGQGPELWHGLKNADTKLLPDFSNPLTYVALTGGVLGVLAGPGVVLVQLKGVRKESITWQAALAQGLEYVWRFLGLTIVSLLILGVATLLFIVPLFIVLPRIFLAPYYLVDRKAGVIEALKMSSADYKAYKGVWGVIGVFVLITLVNVIPGIGWIISNTMSFIYSPAPALRYEQINRLTKGEAARTPIETEVAADKA